MPPFALEDVLPLHLATVTFPDFHPLHGETGEVLGFAIRHDHGLVLFDTGVGEGEEVIDRWYEPVRRPLADELARHGHALADVTAIVNSHLHFDHCGNNALLPGVPIYAQSDELAAAREPMYTVPAWIDFEGAEYRVVDGDASPAPGVRVIRTPGHTGGHQSVVLDATDAPIVLAGQAIYSVLEYEHIARHDALLDGDPPPEPPTYLSSARQLIGLRPRRVHFSHDAAIWEPAPVS